MRLDKYLKVSRIIKRRTVANDVIELTLGARTVKARVVSVNEYAKKDEAAMMYEIIEEK